MIPPEVADPVRLTSGVLSIVLIFAACYAVLLSVHLDQRVRFGLFAAFGFIHVSSHLTRYGQGATWYLPGIAVLVALAVWSTIKYVRRELAARARGGHADDHGPPGGRHV